VFSEAEEADVVLVQRLFRTKTGKRAGHGDYAMSYADADASYLVTPHMVRSHPRAPVVH
jgi:hypothetical protein